MVDSFGGGGLTTSYVDSGVCGGSNTSYAAGQMLGGLLKKPIDLIKQYGGSVMKYLGSIIIIILLAVMVYYIGQCYSNSDNKSVGAFGKSVFHRKCKAQGGCGRKCPYVAADDPRVVIHAQAEQIRKWSRAIDDSLQEIQVKIPELVMILTDTGVKKSVQDKCDLSYSSMAKAANNITTLFVAAKSINAKYGDEATISTDLVNARNRMAGLHAAAAIMTQYFVASLFALYAFARNQFIMQRSKEDPAFVSDTLVHESNTKQAELGNLYTTTFDGKFGDQSDYFSWVSALYKDDTTVGTLIDNMVNLMTLSATTQKVSEQMRVRFEEIEIIYDRAARAGFTNSLPGKVNTETMSALIANNDYDSAVKLSALEPEIATNHAKFAKERASFDSGGGVPSVRDDDNDIIPWVGLFGRPSYRRSDGTSADASSSEPLRSIPSQNPDDLMREKSVRISFST